MSTDYFGLVKCPSRMLLLSLPASVLIASRPCSSGPDTFSVSAFWKNCPLSSEASPQRPTALHLPMMFPQGRTVCLEAPGAGWLHQATQGLPMPASPQPGPATPCPAVAPTAAPPTVAPEMHPHHSHVAVGRDQDTSQGPHLILIENLVFFKLFFQTVHFTKLNGGPQKTCPQPYPSESMNMPLFGIKSFCK